MEQEFNAQIALLQTKQAVVTKQNKAFEEEYEAAIRQIKEAVKNGQYSVNLNISDRLLKQLILSNFTITRPPQDLAHKVTISWNKEETPEQQEPQQPKAQKPSILKKKSVSSTLPKVSKQQQEEEMETVYEQPAPISRSLPTGMTEAEQEEVLTMEEASEEDTESDDENFNF